MKFSWRPTLLILCLLVTFLSLYSDQPTYAQEDTPTRAEQILAQMDVRERVGQLFLVAFQGDDITPTSDITDLLLTYKVGGVALLPENDNLTNPDNNPTTIAQLTNTLQQVAMVGTTAFITDTVGELPLTGQLLPNNQPAVPLFITLQAPPYGLPGFTPLPSQMAIGATWQPDYARAVGTLLGAELSAVGINLVTNPILDVWTNPSATNSYNLGTQVFGGNPFWVGRLGQAYIAGIHAGSQQRLAIIASHFPGSGSSDRPIDQEVATVRKSLTELRQTELLPFFAVTTKPPNGTTMVDGLLTTHIRYQGFQGNISANTAPVSFDAQALTSLLQLSELSTWHQQGGLIVSDRLDVRAIQRFYDDTGQTFPHRQVAKDALLAGNDVLYVANFALEGAPSSQAISNIKDTITSFWERYEADATFQQRIDAAVLKIISTKLRLYGDDFSLSNVLVDTTAPLPTSTDTSLLNIASEAITLLAPNTEELPARLPSPPGNEDNIVIFTDIRDFTQCSTCPPRPLIPRDALAARLLALYGPATSGQVQAEQIQSYTFTELKQFLNSNTPSPTPASPTPNAAYPAPRPTPTPLPATQLENALANADWIIFALLNVTPSAPDSNALNLFLAQRPDIVRQARVVAFAYDAPYYLDTTEISKLTAYYGVYSHAPSFLDTSVRVLFQELPVFGRPPMNVEGINYNLNQVIQPNPEQLIDLYIVSNAGDVVAPLNTAPLEVTVGETLRFQTGVILDRNGHIVPDGTLVDLHQLDREGGFTSLVAQKPTVNGVATFDYFLEDRVGQFRITVSAGQAIRSAEIDIAIGENVRVVILTPTPLPIPTDTPTVTPSSPIMPSPTMTPPPTATPMPSGMGNEPTLQIPIAGIRLLFGMGSALLLLSVGVLFLGQNHAPKQIVPLLIWGWLGGIVVYLYFTFALPGVASFLPMTFILASGVTIAGSLLGIFIYWLFVPKP